MLFWDGKGTRAALERASQRRPENAEECRENIKEAQKRHEEASSKKQRSSTGAAGEQYGVEEHCRLWEHHGGSVRVQYEYAQAANLVSRQLVQNFFFTLIIDVLVNSNLRERPL